MRFLADMGVSMYTVRWLRAQGHEAVHVRELGRQRASDAEILAIALADQRAVITMDLDFGQLLAITGGRLPSVILLRLATSAVSTSTNG